MAKSDNAFITLRVAAEFLKAESTDQRPAVAAYAYSDGGRLLSYAALGEKGETKLELPVAREASAVRVVLGPAPEEKQPPALEELLRFGEAA